jgi:hypothetical protein
MLDTIRQLTITMKLKDLIIANFIPEDFAKNMEVSVDIGLLYALTPSFLTLSAHSIYSHLQFSIVLLVTTAV